MLMKLKCAAQYIGACVCVHLLGSFCMAFNANWCLLMYLQHEEEWLLWTQVFITAVHKFWLSSLLLFLVHRHTACLFLEWKPPVHHRHQLPADWQNYSDAYCVIIVQCSNPKFHFCSREKRGTVPTYILNSDTLLYTFLGHQSPINSSCVSGTTGHMTHPKY